ncbi:MAG TPA: helix-turn-helix domain-containing protein [Acidimicrobiales bacterium]|nr:helix-turn-helix domain-containing protein [Acidimicrobiales bacterium]
MSQRQRILDTALSLMAQRGVDGTSMRDLAQATGLNVASLYHYFPSKKDLLVAVLAERGFLDDMASATAPTGPQGPTVHLDDLLEELLRSMLEVEDFIRLMLGEVMRGDDTALGLGRELMSTTQEALERWLAESQPQLCEGPGAAAVARMLRAMLIGVFFEHVAGVLDGDDPSVVFRRRAQEAAEILGADDS